MTVQAPVSGPEGLKNGDWIYAAYLANGDNRALAADAVESLAGLLPG
jgi:hypothetical protein